jgi:hypothetical protein
MVKGAIEHTDPDPFFGNINSYLYLGFWPNTRNLPEEPEGWQFGHYDRYRKFELLFLKQTPQGHFIVYDFQSNDPYDQNSRIEFHPELNPPCIKIFGEKTNVLRETYDGTPDEIVNIRTMLQNYYNTQGDARALDRNIKATKNLKVYRTILGNRSRSTNLPGELAAGPGNVIGSFLSGQPGSQAQQQEALRGNVIRLRETVLRDRPQPGVIRARRRKTRKSRRSRRNRK